MASPGIRHLLITGEPGELLLCNKILLIKHMGLFRGGEDDIITTCLWFISSTN